MKRFILLAMAMAMLITGCGISHIQEDHQMEVPDISGEDLTLKDIDFTSEEFSEYKELFDTIHMDLEVLKDDVYDSIETEDLEKLAETRQECEELLAKIEESAKDLDKEELIRLHDQARQAVSYYKDCMDSLDQYIEYKDSGAKDMIRDLMDQVKDSFLQGEIFRTLYH